MSKPTGSKGRGRSRSNNSKRSIGRSNNHDSQIGRNRGNPQQMMDKYLSLARDSLSQGDRVSAENFFQHADHYQRVVTEKNEKQESRRRSVHHQNGENNTNNVDKKPANNSVGSNNLENNSLKPSIEKTSNDLSVSSNNLVDTHDNKVKNNIDNSLDSKANKSTNLSGEDTVVVIKSEKKTAVPPVSDKSSK